MIIILQGNNQIRFENSESNHEWFDLIRNFQIMAPAKILPSNQIKSRNFQIVIQIILNHPWKFQIWFESRRQGQFHYTKRFSKIEAWQNFGPNQIESNHWFDLISNEIMVRDLIWFERLDFIRRFLNRDVKKWFGCYPDNLMKIVFF